MKDPVARYLRNRAERGGHPVAVGELDGLAQVVAIPILAESAELGATLASLAANPLTVVSSSSGGRATGSVPGMT